ncbi:tRNA nuclease WapA [bacterium HR15]|nr:tRNA nuclease WapA [bacterium HR15]
MKRQTNERAVPFLRNGRLVYEARYDAFRNRVWAKVDAQERYYLYEGDTLVAELDANGNLVAEYVWGLLGPIARVASEGTVQFYVLDGLGHVRALVGRVGNSWQVTDTYAYDSWGNPIGRTWNTQQPFTWNGAYGYEYNLATGLYHVGAREYDPRTARWLQRDPIDATGGDPNLYRYAGNDPVNGVDPSGLDWLDNTASFFAGWGDRLTGGLTGHVRDWLCDILDLPRWEPSDACDERYLVGCKESYMVTGWGPVAADWIRRLRTMTER